MRLMTLIPAGGLFALVFVLFAQLARHLDAVDLIPLEVNLLTVVYLVIELICVGIQSVGAVISPPNDQSLGKTLLLVGFIIQIVSFATFTGLYVLFAYRLKKSRPEEWKARPYGRFKHFTFFLYMMGFACQNLLIRTAYRLLEAIQGSNGKLAKSELWFYMLDALQLLNVVLGFVVLWPPYYLRPATRIRLGNASSVELRDSPGHSKVVSSEVVRGQV
ncbi:hypothetical protein FS749_014991 [Ceratobasidium sp. UAMH 11750]|nr:hypothetical protein FS749_014991 [Ceratobasidium sp. UAMH 11750]